MTWGSRQLSFAFSASESADVRPVETRTETRAWVVRPVEFRPFPRASRGHRERLGFTRDVSDSGLCLRAETPEPTGSLLHVIVHGADGGPAFQGVARVAWCQETVDEAHWIGLELLETREWRPRLVRPALQLSCVGM
jgi:hypothetical protein